MKSLGKLIILFSLMPQLLGVASAAVKECEGVNHPAYQSEYRACLRLKISAKAKEEGVDCADCIFDHPKEESNALVETLGVLAQPLAYLAASYTIAKYENKALEKWANAFASGYQQCTNRFNSFLDYQTTIGANPITVTEANAFSSSCNGFGYGNYAGYGGMASNGYGGFSNNYQAMGYTPNFLNLYGGPYASGSGGASFSASIGISSSAGSANQSTSSVYQSGVVPAFSF